MLNLVRRLTTGSKGVLVGCFRVFAVPYGRGGGGVLADSLKPQLQLQLHFRVVASHFDLVVNDTTDKHGDAGFK